MGAESGQWDGGIRSRASPGLIREVARRVATWSTGPDLWPVAGLVLAEGLTNSKSNHCSLHNRENKMASKMA